jgi:hypothetical protein
MLFSFKKIKEKLIMTTGFTIATILKNGKIGMIYGYADGYLAYTGRILVNHYQTFDKARKLINLGELEVIGQSLDPSELVLRYGWNATLNDSFKKLPQDEQKRLYDDNRLHVSAYHRDRGEELRINTFKNIPQYMNFLKDNGSEFNYFQGYNSNNKPQWNLVLNDGFHPLIDDINSIGKFNGQALNLAELDNDEFWDKQFEQKKSLIIEFLKTLGQEYHLGDEGQTDEVEPFYDNTYGEVKVNFYDPVSFEEFPISIQMSSDDVTLNFVHSVLLQIRHSVSKQLSHKLPLYKHDDLPKLEQMNEIKDEISNFYRTKLKEDPRNVGFNYLVALCQDQKAQENADKNGLVLQDWELDAKNASQLVKPYIKKKVDKLYSDLKKQKLKNISLTINDISELNDEVSCGKTGYYDTHTKFSDYMSRLVRGQNPADPAQFADPYLNSKLYCIINKFYEQVVMKDAEHKLEQAVVLASDK